MHNETQPDGLKKSCLRVQEQPHRRRFARRGQKRSSAVSKEIRSRQASLELLERKSKYDFRPSRGQTLKLTPLPPKLEEEIPIKYMPDVLTVREQERSANLKGLAPAGSSSLTLWMRAGRPLHHERLGREGGALSCSTQQSRALSTFIFCTSCSLLESRTPSPSLRTPCSLHGFLLLLGFFLTASSR